MGKKILLADDSITIQKVIELTFSDEDFEVVTVGNGRLAIEKAQEVRPDVVLCDIIMPEKDGYEVCDFIKKSPTLSHVPVLLLTGAFEPFDQERAARVGCDGFLAKPFEPQTLIAKVKDLLSQAASKQPAAAPPPAPRVTLPPFQSPMAAPEPARQAPPTFVAPPPSFAAPEPEPELPTAEPMGFDAMSFEPVSPSAYEPVSFDVPDSFDAPAAAPAPAPRAAEPHTAFMPEEAFAGEPIEEATFADAMELPADPDPEPMPVSSHMEAETVQDSDLYSVPEPLEASADDDLMALHDEDPPPAPEPIEDDASTVMFAAGAAPWASPPTVEVPLEDRAQAGIESQMETDGPMFEEVFDEEAAHAGSAAAPRPVAVAMPAAAVPPPTPPTPAPPAPVVAAPPPPMISEPEFEPEPEPMPELEEASFEDVAATAAPSPTPAAAAPATPSEAAQVAVPMDMVAQIAQRVVAQISEKVVREVAWEVIPDLAEALIKKEIERLKAELQQI
jgi:CheY-like chemotaxis protein